MAHLSEEEIAAMEASITVYDDIEITYSGDNITIGSTNSDQILFLSNEDAQKLVVRVLKVCTQIEQTKFIAPEDYRASMIPDPSVSRKPDPADDEWWEAHGRYQRPEGY